MKINYNSASPDKIAVIQFLTSKNEDKISKDSIVSTISDFRKSVYNLRQLGSDSKTSFRKMSCLKCESGTFDRRKRKTHLHTASLDAASMSTAHVNAAVPDIDVIYRPCLLLVKRSWLMPTETSGLGPLKKKRIIMKYVVEKGRCSGISEHVHGDCNSNAHKPLRLF